MRVVTMRGVERAWGYERRLRRGNSPSMSTNRLRIELRVGDSVMGQREVEEVADVIRTVEEALWNHREVTEIRIQRPTREPATKLQAVPSLPEQKAA